MSQTPETAQDAAPQRRGVLGLTALAGAVAATGTPASAHAATADPVLHLLRRATYGPTPALVAEVRRTGTAAWLKAQLSPASVPDPVIDRLMPRWPERDWSPLDVRERVAPGDPRWRFMYGTVERHLARAIWSRRQLFEVMVDVWTNHLVVPVPHLDIHECAHLYQRDVVRRYAMGRYADLLSAAVRHPALLRVLNLSASTRSAPNENHARELLELHTVGVGRFSEDDVRAVARVLTGLTVDQATGRYRFVPERHWVGPVRVLGWSHANDSAAGGEQAALSLLAYLARHPHTAQRIATKLAVRFVADVPPASLVRTLAAAYLSADTAVVPVLRLLFGSPEFAAAAGQKVRTPYEDTVATFRIAGVQPEPSGTAGLLQLVYALRKMGQVPMGWQAPDGYPDVAAAWSATSNTLRRWNLHLGIVAGWGFSTFPRPAPAALVPARRPTTHGALMDALAARLLVPPLTAGQRRALCAYVDRAPADPLRAADHALGWRLPYLAALILDSPNFVLR